MTPEQYLRVCAWAENPAVTALSLQWGFECWV